MSKKHFVVASFLSQNKTLKFRILDEKELDFVHMQIKGPVRIAQKLSDHCFKMVKKEVR